MTPETMQKLLKVIALAICMLLLLAVYFYSQPQI